MSCRCGLDATLGWVWDMPQNAPPIGSPGWENPYTKGVAQKKKKKKKKKSEVSNKGSVIKEM